MHIDSEKAKCLSGIFLLLRAVLLNVYLQNRYTDCNPCLQDASLIRFFYNFKLQAQNYISNRHFVTFKFFENIYFDTYFRNIFSENIPRRMGKEVIYRTDRGVQK
jgi:hypothetical protein